MGVTAKPKTTLKPVLTNTERRAMLLVLDGADVYDYGIALDLRQVEKKHPEFILITRAMRPPPGHRQQPYFGAKVTRVGRKALDRERREL